MDPLAFMADKFKALGQRSHDLFDGLVHRRRESPSRSRNPIDILKRLQREAFSDLMKLRDRQDKVERILSVYKTAKGSPFQELGTVFRGEVDFLGGLFMNRSNEDEQNGLDIIRTGLNSRFSFETTIRDNDALVVEFVGGQNHYRRSDDLFEGNLSLAKVFYTANSGDWLSTFFIPMGGKCSDVAIVTNPSHQGKGLSDISSSAPPLLSQQNGSAIGVMVKKSNVVGSLAQFVSGLGTHFYPKSCFGTFGQIAIQLPKGTKLSLLGLLQVPNSSPQFANRGPFSFTFGGRESREETHNEQSMDELVVPRMRSSSRGNSSTGSMALMVEAEVDEYTKIGGWVETNDMDPKHLKWALSYSDDCEDSFGYGMKFSGTKDGPKNFDQFQVETYMKFYLGNRFSVKPGMVYIRDGNTSVTALMLRSNWSL